MPMPRSALRVLFIVILVLLAVFVPFILSGYSELDKAQTAASYAEAAQHYENAAGRLPWRGDLYELSGHTYYYAKEYARAEAAYRKALRRGTLSPEGWVAWGDVVYFSDEHERAVQIWEQAGTQEDPSEQLYSRLAEIHRSDGEFDKAAEALHKYVALHPEDASAHYRLGLLLTLSDADRALQELIDASRLDPGFGPAVETLRTALNQASLKDETSERFILIGRGLGLVNEWQLARAAFESAVEADAQNAEARAWLGEADQQMGLSDNALKELDQALTLDPDSPAVRGLRGLYFQRLGNFRQALIEFQAAAALEPQNPAWSVSLGEAHSKTGDLILALQAYQNATALAPEDASYWRLLAIFCAQNNVNVKDVGVPAAQKAVVLAPEDADSLDVLGWLLSLDGRYAEAGRMLARALELDPGHASAHFHLGVLLLQTDQRASAYDHLTQARDLGSKDADMVLKQYFP